MPALPELFIVKNARIWTHQKASDELFDIYVWGQKIFKIVPHGVQPESLGGEWTEFEANGQVIMPAGVDLQIHLRVPGQSEKELPETGLRAALRGGICAVLTMPNTKPIIDSLDVLENAVSLVKEAEEQTGVHVYFTIAMTQGQEGRQAVSADSFLKHPRVLAFTDDGKGVARDEVMDKVMAIAEDSSFPLLQHAEMPGHGGVLSPCEVQKKLGLPSYPDTAEIEMVARDLELLKKYPNARYHVQHVSLIESVRLVDEAKKLGLKATCEVTPHHLLFSRDDIVEGNTSFKMNPPLRSENDRKALVFALADGRIDFVSTDHAPHESKLKGNDFLSSAFGTTGLETSLRALFTLVVRGELTRERMVAVFAQVPAAWAGIDDKYGYLVEGFPFNAVLFSDSESLQKVELSEMESLSKNNIFLSYPLAGKVLGVFNKRGFYRFQ